MPATQVSSAGDGRAHWVYRLIFNTIEPICAGVGGLFIFYDPGSYLVTMTRHAAQYPANAGPVAAFLYTQLGGGWLYFAFVEAVILRIYATDMRLWRLLCMGMLLSDAAYAHGCAQAVGSWANWADLSAWTVEDWTVFWTTAPMLAARICFVLGVGVDFTSSHGNLGKKKN
ncbi:hypothetical protein SCUCBS95973_008197 [Sporothrix curviconia]|uniref:DUF7704 domain-containing protein n=1 Tax=Sporothrix curviconia TaxID=1260050 RepID=A0ABP0CJK5_9PEZI